jgi:spore coat protein A, manganese oxidase
MTLNLGRRRFLEATVAGGVGCLVAGHPLAADAAPPRLRKWVDPLPVPPYLVGRADLSMVTSSHRFSSNFAWSSPTLAYVATGSSPTDAYLGPTLVATTGEPFVLTMRNAMGAHPLQIDTSLMGAVPQDAVAPRASAHLHGGNTRPRDDGGPEDFFGVGDQHVYQYGNTQDAAGLWYHDHALGITRLNVYQRRHRHRHRAG